MGEKRVDIGQNDPAVNTDKEKKEPTLRINEKAYHNSYIDKHLMGKGISAEDISECLTNGVEVTNEIKNAKSGSRYFKLEIPGGAGMPGRFVLPELDGPLGGEVANWNCTCEYKFRHGKLAPVIKRDQIPEWLVNFASVLYVIVEKNELPDGKLQVSDGPTKDDPEDSWMLATAHFGPPSRLKPRIPKDCSDPIKLKQYLEETDNWDREQSRVIFVDLETEGQAGLSKDSIKTNENFELMKIIQHQSELIKEAQKQIEVLRRQIQISKSK